MKSLRRICSVVFPAILFLCLFGTAIASANAAQSKLSAIEIAEEIRKSAAEAYAREDWASAIEQYQLLIEQGIADPGLFYNLGTTYAQAGEKGRATWMLVRAQRLAPRNAAISANLEMLNPDLRDQIAVFPIFPLEFVFRLLTLNEWALLAGYSTGICGLILAAMIWFAPTGRLKSNLKRLMTLAAIVAVGGHIFAGAMYYDQAAVPKGVITGAEVYPRASPSDLAERYEFVLPPGTIVRADNAGVPNWIKATYGGKNVVFIRRDQMRFL